ncbi:MAG: hypothetical protein ACI4WX_10555, partial [Aristaeellaceae bacterium]
MNAKRMAALVLAMVMLLECVPAAFAEEMGTAMAQPRKAKYQASWTKNGTTLDDQTLDGDLVLTDMPGMYIDGVLTFTGGGRLVVRSGHHRISRDAVIKGDIVIEGQAELEIDGIVEGEILLDQRTQGNDSWCEVEIGEHAVVRAIRSEGFSGRVTIRGSVSRIEVQGEYGGRDSEPEHTGEFEVVENAYVGTAVIRGDYAASLQARDNALISSLTLDGWGWSGIFGAHVQKLMADGGVYISIEEGAEIDYFEMTGLATQAGSVGAHIGEALIEDVGPNDEVYHGGLWLNKGSTLDTAYVGKDGRLCVNSVDFDECDALTGTPYEQIDWRPLYKETVVDTVYLTSNAELQNKAYIKKLYSKGKTFVLHMGKVGVGYVENSDDYHFMLEDPNRPDGTYHDGIPGLINSNVYADSMGDYMYFKNSNVTFGTGIVLGTVQMDSCHVNLEAFNRIDTLIINRTTNADVHDPQEFESYFVNEGRINNLLLGYVGDWYCHDVPASMTVDKAAVYGMSSMMIYDIGKLYVPSGHKTAESALHNWEARIEEGVRPTQEMLDAQLAQLESDPQSMEGVELITVPAPGEAYYVGEVIPASVRKADGQIIRGGTTKDKAETLKLRSNSIRKRETRDWWYQIEVEPLQTLNLTFDAGEGMGALTVMGPNDDAYTLVSAGEPASADILCRDGGTYYLRLTGAENDYKVVTKATDPIRVDWDVSMQQVDQKGKGEKKQLDLTALDITVENRTRGTQPEFIVTQDAIVMTSDQADPRDTLVLTVKDPEDAFIPASVEVRLSEGKAAKKTTVYEYGSYRATCTDFTDVTMHLYDGEGNYLKTLDENRGVYTVDRLVPGKYQVVMIRGDVGRWRFAKLSDYADFGLEEKRDYRLDAFTLEEGFMDFYPGATVPPEPVIDSPYAIESRSRYEAARSACLAGGSVLMRVEYALENAQTISEAYVDVQIGEGMTVQPEYVTLDGELVPAQIVDGFLRVPVTGHQEGQIAFYAFGGEVEEMLSIARMVLETSEGTQRAYLGFSDVQIQTLSINGSRRSGGTINLYGYGVPGERVTILHNGEYSMSAECDGEGKWYAVMDVEATKAYTDHEFAAALYARTENEMIAPETVTVRVADSFPELESMSLYYYEHGRQRKKEVTAQEFYRGKMHYSYEPGTQFTCKVRFSNADRLEKLYYVRETMDGRTERLPGTYDQATDTWTIVGEFSHAATNGKWKFEYVLTPLPEPQPLPEENLQMIDQLPPAQLQMINLLENHEEGFLADVLVNTEGQNVAELELEVEVRETERDIGELEEEALCVFEDEEVGNIYLLADEKSFDAVRFVFAPKTEEERNALISWLTEMGWIANALAMSESGYQATVEISVFFADLIRGMALGDIEGILRIREFAEAIEELDNLGNMILDLQTQYYRKARESENPKRKQCYDALAGECYVLMLQLTGAKNRLKKEMSWEMLLTMLPFGLISGAAKGLIRQGLRLKSVRNQIHLIKGKLSELRKALPELKSDLDGMERFIDDVVKHADEEAKRLGDEAVEKYGWLKAKNDEFWYELNKLMPNGVYYAGSWTKKTIEDCAWLYKTQIDELNQYIDQMLKKEITGKELLEKMEDLSKATGDLILERNQQMQKIWDDLDSILKKLGVGLDESKLERLTNALLDLKSQNEQFGELMEETPKAIEKAKEAAEEKEKLEKEKEKLQKEMDDKKAEEEQLEKELEAAEQEAKQIEGQMALDFAKLYEDIMREWEKQQYEEFHHDYDLAYDGYFKIRELEKECPADTTPTPT